MIVKTQYGEIDLPDLLDEDSLKLCATVHWTAGRQTAHAVKQALKHYHFVIATDGSIHNKRSILENLPPLTSGNYVAHCRRANSYNIGIGLAGMWDARERDARRGNYGSAPITEQQIQSCIELLAQISSRYDIPVEPHRILGHEEWDSVKGVRQDRWDVNVIPHLGIKSKLLSDGTYESMNYLRRRVRERLRSIQRSQLPASGWKQQLKAFKLLVELIDFTDEHEDYFTRDVRRKLRELRHSEPFDDFDRDDLDKL